jgi:nitroreductase
MPELDNPVLHAIRERRSVRRYTEEPVSADEVRAMLEAARWAPSGKNNQPWRFLAIMGGDARQQALAELTRSGSAVQAAKALIVVALDKSAMYHQIKDHQSCGAAMQNILLAAHSLGLGAVWLGEIVSRERQVFEALSLDPDAYELAAVAAIGRPSQQGSGQRKPLADLLIEPL